jgi:hypothetical protein
VHLGEARVPHLTILVSCGIELTIPKV